MLNEIEKLRERLHETIDILIQEYIENIQKPDNFFIKEIKKNVIECKIEVKIPRETLNLTGFWYDVIASNNVEKRKVFVGYDYQKIFSKQRKRVSVLSYTLSNQLQILVMFIESNNKVFSSTISDVSDPRKKIHEIEKIPERYSSYEVKKTDEIISEVKNGPSLRIIVKEEEVEKMIDHALWTAIIRDRFHKKGFAK